MIYKQQDKQDIIRLELELTSTCNLQCPLCIREFTELPKNEYRSLQDIIEQLDSYPNLKFVTIAGAVSEPTSHPNLFDIIIYLKRRDIEISLFINGDTRTDLYYTKLGLVFRGAKGNVYFTICGSTQELHAKYRVNSDRDRVLRRLDIVNKYGGNCGILTWLVFNYNEADFEANYPLYKAKYNTEFFYTLPVTEHFQTSSTIKLPERLSKKYMDNIDRSDYSNIQCPANARKYIQIAYDGSDHPCSLHRLYGEKHCWECSTKNKAMLQDNMIKNIAEAESEDSEMPMRLYYDRLQK